jgi:hypothetical protein
MNTSGDTSHQGEFSQVLVYPFFRPRELNLQKRNHSSPWYKFKPFLDLEDSTYEKGAPGRYVLPGEYSQVYFILFQAWGSKCMKKNTLDSSFSVFQTL